MLTEYMDVDIVHRMALYKDRKEIWTYIGLLRAHDIGYVLYYYCERVKQRPFVYRVLRTIKRYRVWHLLYLANNRTQLFTREVKND